MRKKVSAVTAVLCVSHSMERIRQLRIHVVWKTQVGPTGDCPKIEVCDSSG